MVGSDMPSNALYGLVVVTCWQRHNSCVHHRNHHLVLNYMLQEGND